MASQPAEDEVNEMEQIGVDIIENLHSKKT
jgi:hypothetical protein